MTTYLVTTLAMFVMSKLEVRADILYPTTVPLTNIVAIQHLGLGLAPADLGRSPNGPCWSVSTELGTCLLFPSSDAAPCHHPRLPP